MQLHSLLLLPGDAPTPLSRVQEHLAYIGEPWSILNPLLQFSVGDPSWRCCFVPLCEQGVGKLWQGHSWSRGLPGTAQQMGITTGGKCCFTSSSHSKAAEPGHSLLVDVPVRGSLYFLCPGAVLGGTPWVPLGVCPRVSPTGSPWCGHCLDSPSPQALDRFLQMERWSLAPAPPVPSPVPLSQARQEMALR